MAPSHTHYRLPSATDHLLAGWADASSPASPMFASPVFWSLFFDTFEPTRLAPAFSLGWHRMMNEARPGLDGVLIHIAAHLGMTPRRLRKMPDRQRAARLLPKLGDIAFLLHYVTDAYYCGRRGPSVGRFLDLAGVPHDDHNIVPRGVPLPSAETVFDSVATCIAEDRSLLAIYRYLTVQAALVFDWGHRARPAIERITAVCPDLASTIDDDRVTPAPATPAASRRAHIAGLETALTAAIEIDRYTKTTWQAACDLLAQQSDHPRAARAIGRIQARRGHAPRIEPPPAMIASDWICAAFLEESHRHDSAAVFAAHARASARQLRDLAGRGEAPARWLGARLLVPLWYAGRIDTVETLLARAYSALKPAEVWQVLDWAAMAGRAGDSALEQRLLHALARHVQSVTGAPIGRLGRAVTQALAESYHRQGEHECARKHYSELLAVEDSDRLRWQAVLNRLQARTIDAVAQRLIRKTPDALREHASRESDIEYILVTRARSSVPEVAGPAHYLLACLDMSAPTPQTAERLSAACLWANDGAQTAALWAAHAVYLQRLVAYQSGRAPVQALVWSALAPLVDDLPVDDWQRLFLLADRYDPPAADRLIGRLVAHGIELPWPVAAKPRYLREGQAIVDAWERQAATPTTGLQRAFDIRRCLFAWYQQAGDIQRARHTLDALETLAESPSGARLVAAWLDDGAELAPAWSARARLWFRLRLAQRTVDRANLPAILMALFFEIRDSEPFAAAELVSVAHNWGCQAMAADLAAALPEAEQSTTHVPAHAEPVSIVFVGGNEIQARRDGAVRARLAQDEAKVSVVFHHVGWDGNWARRVDGLLAECNQADAIVLMPYIRTQFGRTLRAGLNRPWVACPGTGREAMVRSIHEAGRVARRQRRQAGS